MFKSFEVNPVVVLVVYVVVMFGLAVVAGIDHSWIIPVKY